MFNKLLFILIPFYCSVSELYASENETVSIITDINLKGVGIGAGYQFFNKLQTQAIIGISSNFTEKKWDDVFIQSKTQYQVLKSKWVTLPLGLTLGGRAVNNYDDFYGVFYFGVFSGLDFYINKRNLISLKFGYKYGQNRYEITYKSQYGTVSYIEKYKEQPLILSLSYSLVIQ